MELLPLTLEFHQVEERTQDLLDESKTTDDDGKANADALEEPITCLANVIKFSIEVVKKPDKETLRCKQQCDLWAYCWASGAVLAEILLQREVQNKVLENKKVIELGCGLGLPSLACSYPRNCQVAATDLVEDALDLVTRNDEAINPSTERTDKGEHGSKLCTSRLNWHDWGSIEIPNTVIESPLYKNFDICLAADVTFIGSNLKPVLRSISRLLASAESVAVLVDPGRIPGLSELDSYAEDCGLQVIWQTTFSNVECPVCTLQKLDIAIVKKLCSNLSGNEMHHVNDDDDVLRKTSRNLLQYRQDLHRSRGGNTTTSHHTLQLPT